MGYGGNAARVPHGQAGRHRTGFGRFNGLEFGDFPKAKAQRGKRIAMPALRPERWINPPGCAR
jgi:hypothetical protein